MKASEIREKSPEELVELESNLRKELFELRMQLYTGQLEQPSKIRDTRRTIARVLTVIGEKNAD